MVCAGQPAGNATQKETPRHPKDIRRLSRVGPMAAGAGVDALSLIHRFNTTTTSDTPSACPFGIYSARLCSAKSPRRLKRSPSRKRTKAKTQSSLRKRRNPLEAAMMKRKRRKRKRQRTCVRFTAGAFIMLAKLILVVLKHAPAIEEGLLSI